MKIGSVILFIIFSFVALGYLLSDNLNVHEDLVQIQQQYQKLSDENIALQSENANQAQALAESEQKISDLTRVNFAQQEKINLLTSENTNWKSMASGSQCQPENSVSFDDIMKTPITWAFLLPTIPASMAATYGIVYYIRNNTRRSAKKNRRIEYIQLTGEEIEKVIQMRRKK